MFRNKITKIKKRDDTIVKFEQKKITDAIFKSITATGQGDGKKSKRVSNKMVQILNRRFKAEEIPHVEQVQDIVEEILILEGLVEAAKAYILYREQRRIIREAVGMVDESVEMLDKYIEEIDWQVQENANMAYSLQGLNHYGVSNITKRYWLNKIYPREIREAVESGDFHLHNLDTLGPYCMGWDLYDLLIKGFGGVTGKTESKPAKHFQTALGQLVNFFYTLQGECAGAVAVASFDTLLAPFIRYDGLTYREVKQSIQEFMFNCSIPTRVGFQCPFTNLTLDIKPSPTLAKQPVIIGGKSQKETYGEFQEEMDVFNRAFYETMLEGDARGRPFHFPIPTINITKDFDWQDPNLNPMWEATAKYGINYFANFIRSDMKPEDTRSMCCRLRLDNRELYQRGGGLFGSYPLTGSVGVVTINLPRIGYLSKTKREFFEKLGKMMDLAKESLDIKRKTLEDFVEKGLYPYSKRYLEGMKKMRGQYFGNHFSTIGLVGMNEALLNFIGENIGSRRGLRFASEILEFMRERLVKYQKDSVNLYNLEATPAEATAYRLALKDKEKYPDIITAGTKEVPYYTNSSQLPVDYTDDAFGALKLQDNLQKKYTGGTVLHLFLGERISDIETVKALIKKTFNNFYLPYITITPTFSICPAHGYLAGEHFHCPQCIIKQPCEVYSRIVGYLRPVKQWNKGKQEEFNQRKEFKIKPAISQSELAKGELAKRKLVPF
ncbi:MAG TPA: ribonucleoside triphosphate reductase [Candidatus Nealsonbacteria bacterium]|uniref:ATP-cone domain-containing protein n=1 Tax=marine sediment metagenome TaxID=412755 RepID=A0A0F9X3T7_9ZZZZ|nr:ribonucleoside triphosphate reductase [Candidatus Nealsonbacteria bacterium]HEB46451.1 ribonucleoside triphosphate reductase [Candidatus Nealsonbacteria bacterium]